MSEPDHLVDATYDGTHWIVTPASITLPPVSSVLPGTKITISSNEPLIVNAAGWEISEGHVYEAPDAHEERDQPPCPS